MQAVLGVASPWAFEAHWDVWLLVAAIAAGYWAAIRHLGPHLVEEGQPVVTRRQVVLFSLGVAALWVHADWPIHDLGEHYLYGVHMIQHIGFQLIAPPLLLLGTPAWLWRWLLVRPRRLHAVVRRITRPLPAFALFNVVTILTHWPLVVDYSLYHHPTHFLVHLLMFVTSLIMWVPVVNPIPELPTLSPGAKMIYLFLESILPTVPASFLTFGDGVLYKFYAHAPRPFSISALEDQQVAGAMMKVYGGGLLWAAILVIFVHWYQRDQKTVTRPPIQRSDGGSVDEAPVPGSVDDALPDVLTWNDVEQRLRSTSPAPPT